MKIKYGHSRVSGNRKAGPLHWAARRGNEMMVRLLDKATKGLLPMLYPRPAWYVIPVFIVRLASDVQLDQPTVVTPLSSKKMDSST